MTLFQKFYLMAREAKLSFPSGRAWYLVGRHYNAGAYRGEPLDIMSRMKEETARRWNKHYGKGGSAKCLGRTQEEESKRRKEYYINWKKSLPPNHYHRHSYEFRPGVMNSPACKKCGCWPSRNTIILSEPKGSVATIISSNTESKWVITPFKGDTFVDMVKYDR